MPPVFSKEEIEAEEKRPKRKVAVLIGYSGTGYKGMQLDYTQKTIEGDLFAAFVAAGAISKANADDPKKSSFVRCARTDKGVHAAGNVISLKLIIEDPDIVEKINSHLSPQIRIWGMLRTVGSFSCYQACDSRQYEYLIPTHSFIPPHPSSYLGQKVAELAREAGDLEGYRERQKEISGFWEEVEEKHINPILETLEAESRALVEKALYGVSSSMDEIEDPEDDELDGAMLVDESTGYRTGGAAASVPVKSLQPTEKNQAPVAGAEESHPPPDQLPPESNASSVENPTTSTNGTTDHDLDKTIKALRQAYISAKKTYRISPDRLTRVRDVLSRYYGTQNFHNYTVRKQATDPSAKRLIKSFTVSEPILIGDTEWLSLKVHGQSFMMHQIRKMIGMAALIVRCGCPPDRIDESLGKEVFAIPKAPGLGLLLERPVFESYNQKATEQFDREPIDFDKYKDEMEEFKRREIYERIFREEEAGDVFHNFFAHVDNYKESTFLYVSSKGLEAAENAREIVSGKKDLSRRERKKFRKKDDRKEIWAERTIGKEEELLEDAETLVGEDEGLDRKERQDGAEALVGRDEAVADNVSDQLRDKA